MKKFRTLLWAVLISALAFPFTACSDDEPDGSGKELTIDGKKYSFNYFVGDVTYGSIDNGDYACMLANPDKGDYQLWVQIWGWDTVKKGTVWDSEQSVDDDSEIHLSWYEDTENLPAVVLARPQSGKITVTDLNKSGNTITLKFDNAEFYGSYSSGGLKTFTVSGTITLPIDDIWF